MNMFAVLSAIEDAAVGFYFAHREDLVEYYNGQWIAINKTGQYGAVGPDETTACERFQSLYHEQSYRCIHIGDDVH